MQIWKNNFISRGCLHLPQAICTSIGQIYPIGTEVYLEPSQTSIIKLSAKIAERYFRLGSKYTSYENVQLTNTTTLNTLFLFLFLKKNNFIGTKVLILGKKIKQARKKTMLAVTQNIGTKCLEQDIRTNWNVYIILVPWFLTDFSKKNKLGKNMNKSKTNIP